MFTCLLLCKEGCYLSPLVVTSLCPPLAPVPSSLTLLQPLWWNPGTRRLREVHLEGYNIPIPLRLLGHASGGRDKQRSIQRQLLSPWGLEDWHHSEEALGDSENILPNQWGSGFPASRPPLDQRYSSAPRSTTQSCFSIQLLQLILPVARLCTMDCIIQLSKTESSYHRGEKNMPLPTGCKLGQLKLNHLITITACNLPF